MKERTRRSGKTARVFKDQFTESRKLVHRRDYYTRQWNSSYSVVNILDLIFMILFYNSFSFLLLFIVRVKNPYYEYRNRKPKLKIKYFVNSRNKLHKTTRDPPPGTWSEQGSASTHCRVFCPSLSSLQLMTQKFPSAEFIFIYNKLSSSRNASRGARDLARASRGLNFVRVCSPGGVTDPRQWSNLGSPLLLVH